MNLRAAILATFLIAQPVGSAFADDEGLTPDLTTRLSTGVSNVFFRAQDLVLNAMGMMGIPYRWGGATPEAGFDCSGFVQYVVKQALGITLPRSSFDQVKLGQAVERDQLQAGDLVFFNTMRAPASHVGIYLGENRFIHAPTTGRTVEIVTFTDVYWQQRFTGARRLPM